MYRPKYHFTPKKGWMNDPNGLVVAGDTVHYFYQYYPNDTVWGPMHWGHAVSTDFKNWEDLPIALEPDELGLIFSGSAVYDEKNTAGFGEGAIIAMYTSHGDYEQQSIAYSLDGVNFTKYEGNPVLPNNTRKDYRDPKVFRLEDGWGLVLAAGAEILFYKSKDLIHWTESGNFAPFKEFDGFVYECPSMIQIDGKWVLMVSIGGASDRMAADTFYWIGQWTGTAFEPETDKIPLDFARDDYAAVTYDGAPVLVGWASQWVYANQTPTAEEGFRSQTTHFRKLSIVETANGLMMAQQPITDDDPIIIKGCGPIEVRLAGLTCGVDENNCVFMKRDGGHDFSEHFDDAAYSDCRIARVADGPYELSIYKDGCVAECYIDGGTRVGTMLIF